jgi:hypothetical protein
MWVIISGSYSTITYSKGRQDDMIISIHPSRHPSKQNKYIFLKGKKLEKKIKTEKHFNN